MADAEYTDEIRLAGDTGARKRKQNKLAWKKHRNKSKKYKQEGKEPLVRCVHQRQRWVQQHSQSHCHDCDCCQQGQGQGLTSQDKLKGSEPVAKGFCAGYNLSTEDAIYFFEKLYQNQSKANQDEFLLKYMQINLQSGAQKRRQRRIRVRYMVRKKDGMLARVCATLFRNITCVTRDRLNRLSRFVVSHACPKSRGERRGGARCAKKHESVTNSIIKHIQSFRCRDSHYQRSKSVRKYLPPELSIRTMHRMWKTVREKHRQPTCTYDKYRRIFCTKFNIGFGSPRTDTCSTCAILHKNIVSTENQNEKQKLITERRVHKLKASKFHHILRQKNPNEVTISFDMQQNQPLPKLSVGETYYSRQVWIYNLTFVAQGEDFSSDKTSIYTWLETESGKGSNEVSSALRDYLLELDRELYSLGRRKLTLRLFSDACPGQNKNFTVLTMLGNFISHAKSFDNIIHHFPIRGHSFLPPDRVFGRIEQELRKRENILSPEEYVSLFSQFGTVRRLGIEWTCYDYKSVSHKLLKGSNSFKFSEQKVFKYAKSQTKSVQVQVSYSSLPEAVYLLKPNKSFCTMSKPNSVPKINKVTVAKMNDVKKLTKFFTIPANATEFYNDVFRATENQDLNELTDMEEE